MMSASEAMYVLHWLVLGAMLAISWIRSRHYLHPHFMFTLMLCITPSDFLVRGYDDYNLYGIPLNTLYGYQFIVLFILLTTVVLTAFVRSAVLEHTLHTVIHNVDRPPPRRIRYLIAAVAAGLLVAELVKRLMTVDWSFDTVIFQSMMPRGQRDWDQLQYQGNFIFAIIAILLPAAGIGFAYLSTSSKAIGRVVSLMLTLIVVVILTTNGSRTYVGIVLAALCFFWMRLRRGLAWRASVLAVGALLVVTIFSSMYQFRGTGYHSELRVVNEREFAFVYHQDDNYYRTLYSYDWADRTAKKLDPLYFFYAIAVNPMPRALWPEKPILDMAFFGTSREDGATTWYLGEIVAMFGVELSFILGPLIGLMLYLAMYNSQRLLRYPFGIACYLLMTLYIYMCLRSLMDLTQDLYLPAFSIALALVLSKLGWRSSGFMKHLPLAKH
jgi:hypothetical protein